MDENTPQVSENRFFGFCIPTYNRQHELAACLDHLIFLAAPHGIPIYISDNASNYDFDALIGAYRNRYPHIHARRNARNEGMGANFLHVVAMAETRYVWLFSDDDKLTPDALEKILPLCASGEYDLIVPNREYRKADLSFDYGKCASDSADDQVIADADTLLVEACVKHFTYIGCLVFKTEAWRAVEGSKYLPYQYFPHVCIVAEMMKKRAPAGSKAILLAAPLIYVRGGGFSWEKRAVMVWYYYLQQCLSLLPGYPLAVIRRALWRVWKEMSIYPHWLVARHGTRLSNLNQLLQPKTLRIYWRLHAPGMLLANLACAIALVFIPARALDGVRALYRKRRMPDIAGQGN